MAMAISRVVSNTRIINVMRAVVVLIFSNARVTPPIKGIIDVLL